MPGPSAVYTRAITIDHTKVGGVDQTNFAVLISGTYTYLKTIANGGRLSNSSGNDVWFTSDSGGNTLLDFEVETLNTTTGVVNVWVRVPTVSSSVDTVIYMQYANGTQTASRSNATGTWDANYKAVYHLKDGSSLTLTDSTGVNNGTNHSATATTGQINGGMATSGSQYVSVNDSASLKVTTTGTISAWVKTSASTADQAIMSKISAADGYIGYEMISGPTSGANGKIGFWNGTGWVGSNTSIADGNWHYVAVTWDGTTARFYKDGAADGTPADGAPSSSTTAVALADRSGGGGFLVWTGSLDEIRLSNSTRTASWITSNYNNQNSPSTFYSVGAEVFNPNLLFAAR